MENFPESSTRAVNVNAPVWVVDPEIFPAELSVIPVGKAPLVIFQLYGGVPPVAARVWEYLALVRVFGRLAVVITSAGIGARFTVALPDLVLSALLVAVTVAVVAVVTQGAVYSPVLVIEPLVTFQVTPVFVVFLTVAVNC